VCLSHGYQCCCVAGRHINVFKDTGSAVSVSSLLDHFSKIQIGFTFLVPAHLGSPGQRAVKRVCIDHLMVS